MLDDFLGVTPLNGMIPSIILSHIYFILNTSIIFTRNYLLYIAICPGRYGISGNYIINMSSPTKSLMKPRREVKYTDFSATQISRHSEEIEIARMIDFCTGFT